jgi:hypothetical protein
MAGSIGRVEGRVGGFVWRSAVHLLGGIVGGAALGLILIAAALAGESMSYRNLIAIVGFALFAGAQLFYPRLRFGSKRQVPMGWSEILGPYGSLFAWGAALAVGFFTQTRSLLVWALPAAALVSDPAGAFSAGVVFGASRSLSAAGLAAWLADPAHACRILGYRRMSDVGSFAAMAAFLIAAL